MDKKILAVDDEERIVNLLKDGLSKEGFTVFTASDGQQGFKEAKKVLPDLIILDVQMGKMDGFSVLKKLKQDRKTRDIPIMMLTGRGSPDDVAEGMENYAENYVTKPFHFSELLEKIHQIFSVRGF